MTKTELKAKAKHGALRLGHHFQEVVIAGLTIGAGITISNIWLMVFGLMILMASALKEFDVQKSQSSKNTQNLAYALFIIGYVGGGSNFILTFFKPEFHVKAFIGLSILAISYVVQAVVEYIEKSKA